MQASAPAERRRAETGLAVVGALLVSGAVFARTRAYGFTAFDTLPAVAASRVRSWSDFWGTFTEPLMDGRFAADFYRPVHNASLALDHALWGLDPEGYQLTGALLHGACGLAVFVLARALGARGASPWLAAVVYWLHPLAVEWVPVPARRSELLCSLFLCLALAGQLARRPVVAALCALAAIGSKEAGLAVLVLGAVVGFVRPGQRDLPERMRAAGAGAALYLAPVSVGILARVFVLGGLGGYALSPDVVLPADVAAAFTRVVGPLVRPQPEMAMAAVTALLGCAVVGAMGAAFAHSRLAGDAAARGSAGSLAAVAGGFVAVPAGVYAIVGQVQPWYLALPVVGVALGFAAVGELGRRALAPTSAPARAFAIVATAPILVLGVWQASWSPLVRSYPHWQIATKAADEFYAELRERIESVPDGTSLAAPPVPYRVPTRPAPDAPAVYGAYIVADYSIRAWAELFLPERTVRVKTGGALSRGGADAGEVVVVIRRLAPEFARPGDT